MKLSFIKHTIKQNHYRFRRFKRKGYAVFASLHREVSIGRLSVSTTICQERKGSALIPVSLFEMFFYSTGSEPDEPETEHTLFTDALLAVAIAPMSNGDAAACTEPPLNRYHKLFPCHKGSSFFFLYPINTIHYDCRN